jgi:hypothetical protein
LKPEVISRVLNFESDIKKKSSKMKDMCAKYFEKVDEINVKQAKAMEEIKETYAGFKRMVYDPTR